MARPKKPVNYEEELMRIDAQITRWQKTVKELEQQRQELLEQKEQYEMAQIYEVFKRSGMSSEELLSLLTAQSSMSA